MSAESNPLNVIIPPEAALIFAAPEGGVVWKLRNTAQGLVFETGAIIPAGVDRPASIQDRPVFRLMPEKALIRGDLGVDGLMGREFDAHKFVGRWKVLNPGGAPGDSDVAIIGLESDGLFRLTYEKNGQPGPYEYFLRFHARTGTLDCEESRNQSHPDRCISFWDGKARGGDGKHRIFAMRRTKGPGPVNLLHYLPWEINKAGDGLLDDDNGTWGAEEEGPPAP